MPHKNFDTVLLSKKNGIGVGLACRVAEFKTKNLVISALQMKKGDSILVKCQGSFQQEAPDFSSVKSETNIWDYIQMEDLNDRSTVDGDTGVVFEDASDIRLFSIKIDGLRWLSVEVFSISNSDSCVSTIAHLYNEN